MNERKKYTEEFGEIAGRIPDSYTSFIIWGLVIFIGVLILLSVIIKVPETVVAEVKVTSIKPPIVLKAQSDGKVRILNDNFPRKCRKDEYLAIIENAADYNHVYLLKHILIDFDQENEGKIDSILATQSLFLGDIEMPFYEFVEALQNYKQLCGDSNEFEHQISLLQQEIKSNEEFLKSQKKLVQLNMQYHGIKEKQFTTDSLLYTKGAILEKEMENSYSNVLVSQQQIANTNSSILSTSQSITQSKLKMVNLREEYNCAIEKAKLQLNKTYHNLLSNIGNWEKSFVFFAPDDGIVELANIVSDASYVTSGDPIFNIVYSENSYYGIAILPADGAGNVAKGEKVNLKLDLYPYQEYGVLKGTVSSISLNSIEKNYLVYINIPKGLISETQKELSFAETMYGVAEIITEEKRLVSKIFKYISCLFNNDKKTQGGPIEQKNSKEKNNAIQF